MQKLLHQSLKIPRKNKLLTEITVKAFTHGSQLDERPIIERARFNLSAALSWNAARGARTALNTLTLIKGYIDTESSNIHSRPILRE